jgi:hypothetical protein
MLFRAPNGFRSETDRPIFYCHKRARRHIQYKLIVGEFMSDSVVLRHNKLHLRLHMEGVRLLIAEPLLLLHVRRLSLPRGADNGSTSLSISFYISFETL